MQTFKHKNKTFLVDMFELADFCYVKVEGPFKQCNLITDKNAVLWDDSFAGKAIIPVNMKQKGKPVKLKLRLQDEDIEFDL